MGESGATGTYATIEVAIDGDVATVTLNRPDVRNALNARMIAELVNAFRALGQREDLRAIVLRGNGAAFNAGADLTWMRAGLELSHEENLVDAGRLSDMFEAINAVPVPVVGRVHGASLGAGMGLMAVCDIVIAEEGTVCGFTEVRLGIIPAVISPYVIAKIGETWARALFLTGERFGAEHARQIGLVHWVVESAEMDGVVAGKIGELRSAGPQAAREAKRLIRGVLALPPGERRDYTAERIATVRTSDEGQAGIRAFLEKRAAPWRDR